VAPKRLELLHEFVPAAKSIALLVNPANPAAAEEQAKELRAAVAALGLNLMLMNASNPLEIEDAFAALVRDRVEAQTAFVRDNMSKAMEATPFFPNLTNYDPPDDAVPT
jgi:ABC-type uncharacterized transport system substrate-binding protein